jgi:hypothetical protein
MSASTTLELLTAEIAKKNRRERRETLPTDSKLKETMKLEQWQGERTNVLPRLRGVIATAVAGAVIGGFGNASELYFDPAEIGIGEALRRIISK